MDGVPASKEYKGGFATKLMLKDLGLAEAAARHCNASVPMSAQAAKLYQQVICLPTGSLHALAVCALVALLSVTVCASVALLSVSTECALSSSVEVLSDLDWDCCTACTLCLMAHVIVTQDHLLFSVILLQVIDAGESDLDFGAIYHRLYQQPEQKS